MGNTNESKSFLQKGEGLRILSIKLNCPFDGKVEPFFDFIIDVLPLEPQRSAKQILNKLTQASQTKVRSKTKDFNQIVWQNEDRKLQIKIVSTKLRNVRSIIVIPNRNWNGSKDLIGVTVRKEKYDEVFDTYFPVAQIQDNSPTQLAGIKNGQYLLGCLQFPYTSINNFIQGLYDRFFDKEVLNKHVYLALYEILQDEVSIKPVLLKRGWGGNGLLGCQFLQGQIFKFPGNFKEKRQVMLQQKKIKLQKQKIKIQIEECNGASKTLAQALKNKHKKKGKHMQNLRNMISTGLNQDLNSIPSKQQENLRIHQVQQILQPKSNIINQQNTRIEFLENRVFNLEQTLTNVRQYLSEISQEEENNRQNEIQLNREDQKT